MRDNYAAEARDEHLTKLSIALYIIIALVNKTSKYLSKTNEVETMLEIGEKKTQSLRFFWYREIRDIW